MRQQDKVGEMLSKDVVITGDWLLTDPSRCQVGKLEHKLHAELIPL